MSASSWGCELKCVDSIKSGKHTVVSLFVRLWVEIIFSYFVQGFFKRQPLREAVSWNFYVKLRCYEQICQPLREAVSWNVNPFKNISNRFQSASSWGCELKYDGVLEIINDPGQPLREAVSWNTAMLWHFRFHRCQPLREAVSWNSNGDKVQTSGGKSASSWGCELKYQNAENPVLSSTVSLFVRLWVEIWKQNSMSQLPTCQPLREAVSWNTQQIHGNMKKEVSLFVRLWVEISPTHWYPEHYRSSASSWGCELKYDLREDCVDGESVSLFVRLWVEIFETLHSPTVHPGQPLREAVSWNIEIGSIQNSFLVSLFVRLWVEIDRKQQKRWNVWVSLFVRLWVEMLVGATEEKLIDCQPLREAVSWNVFDDATNLFEGVVSLFVRLWVEIPSTRPFGAAIPVSLFVRLWVEILLHHLKPAAFRSASSWGCELKLWYERSIFMAEFVSLFVRLWVEIRSLSLERNHQVVSLFVRLWVEIPIIRFRSTGSCVSLFVRLWVEMSQWPSGHGQASSASSWGCELK